MYINSPGGVVTSGLAIYDTMQYIRARCRRVCMGMAASMGSFLLMAGEHGQRIALPNARIMVHQPSGGFRGQASDIERHAEDIIKTKKRLNELYAKHTGQPIEEVETHPRPRPLHDRRRSQGLGPGRPRLRRARAARPKRCRTRRSGRDRPHRCDQAGVSVATSATRDLGSSWKCRKPGFR